MSLKFCNGGSKIKFSQNSECCIPFCGATREANRTLPFYTFPSDATLCKEWLDEIQFQYKSVEDLNKLQNALVVCSKHFQPHNGGMKLIVEKKHISLEVTNSVTSDEVHSNGNLSTSTQTCDEDWIVFLKKKYAGIEIKCSETIQCRMCSRVSVQAISIYDECNLPLKLENLINGLLPIQVKPTDTKPLNICVDCLLKLKQFNDFSDCCNKNDKLFEVSNKFKNNSDHLNLNKNNNIEVIIVSDSESEDGCNGSITNKHFDGSELSKTNPHDFIKKECRKHKIKILISTKKNHAQNNEFSNNLNANQSTSKVIEVEFIANYIINHGVEWVHEISVDEDQLQTYSQETIDHILEVIRSTMKKQCDIHNSKVFPLPMS